MKNFYNALGSDGINSTKESFLIAGFGIKRVSPEQCKKYVKSITEHLNSGNVQLSILSGHPDIENEDTDFSSKQESSEESDSDSNQFTK